MESKALWKACLINDPCFLYRAFTPFSDHDSGHDLIKKESVRSTHPSIP